MRQLFLYQDLHLSEFFGKLNGILVLMGLMRNAQHRQKVLGLRFL